MINKEILKKIKSELDNAPHGQKGIVIAKWTGRLGLSKHEIYRKIRKIFGNSKNMPSKNKIPEKLIIEIEKIKIQEGKKGKSISTESCIKILIERGENGANKLKDSTVNRRLRKKGFKFIKNQFLKEEILIIKKYRSLPAEFKNEFIKILDSFNKISKQR